MEIKFTHALHNKFITLHYLIWRYSFNTIISYYFLAIINTKNKNISLFDWVIGYFLWSILMIMSMGFLVWGIANLRALKTKKFPLGDYAVRKVLKVMYSKRGLWDPVIMSPYVDENGEKYLKFYFSVHFPIILSPVEVTIKYENFKKVARIAGEIARC